MRDSTLPGQQNHASVERMKEAERERIARDLHDELGSRLSAIKMAVTQFGRRQSSHDTTLQKQMQYVTQLVDDAIDAMRDIIDDLHPTVLDLGLPAALEWLAQVFTRHTGMKYRLLGDDDLPDSLLDAFQTVSLYRIAREALHNASRHASIRNVVIGLHYLDTRLTMEIIDDGVGLPADAASRAESSGIRGMQRRAAAIGATLTLQAAENNGVKLHVELPGLAGASPVN
ncbi:MAG TPA: sensor histidine kinase [Herbaspirillum sp.]|nr:sensor histidine kinase [Herbaspirillum sp.]